METAGWRWPRQPQVGSRFDLLSALLSRFVKFATRPHPKLRPALEPVVVALVAAIAAHQASAYLKKNLDKGHFYQMWFGPAVSVACGGGWNTLHASQDEPLSKFLQQRLSRIECTDVDLTRGAAPLQFQNKHLYLIGAAGLWWKIGGRPDWNALSGLLVFLFVVSTISAYALLRLGAPPLLSGAGAALFAASENQLANLIHFRDYSKAPFLLAGAAAVLLIVNKWKARRSILSAASCTAGIVAGLGVGFRRDVLLLVPFAVVSILFFCGPGLLSDLKKKLALISIFLIAFAVTGAPALRGIAPDMRAGHVILLGLMSPFDGPLGVRSSYYEFGNRYDDAYAVSLFNASHQVDTGGRGFLALGTPEYEKAGMDYLWKLAGMAPADFATRAVGAMVSVLSYDYRFPILRESSWASTLLLVAALLALLARVLLVDISFRAKAYAALVPLYFSGTVFVQYQERHFFHLGVLRIIVLIWGAYVMWRAATIPLGGIAIRDTFGGPARPWRGRIVRGARDAMYFSLVVVTAYAGLAVLRHLQSQRLAAFFERAADPSAYSALSVRTSKDSVRYADADSQGGPLQKDILHLDFAYLMARLSASRCESSHVELVARYEAIDDSRDLTHTHRLALDADTKLLLPVFRSSAFRFMYLEVPSEQANCVSFVGKRRDRRLEFFPIARLDQNWRQRAAYQTLTIEPRPAHHE